MGYNYRLDEIRASLGLSQFQRLDEINKLRQKIAEKYDKKISKIKGLTIPLKKNLRNHIYHLYTIKIDEEYPLTRINYLLNFIKMELELVYNITRYT